MRALHTRARSSGGTGDGTGGNAHTTRAAAAAAVAVLTAALAAVGVAAAAPAAAIPHPGGPCPTPTATATPSASAGPAAAVLAGGRTGCHQHKIVFTDDCDSTTVVVRHTGRPPGRWLVTIASAGFAEEHKLARAGDTARADHRNDVGEITVTITWRGKKIAKDTHTWTPPNRPCPTATPTATPSPSPSVSPTAPPPGGDGVGGGLPVTGAPVPALVAGGVAILLAGAVLLVVRRRRVRFTA